MDYPLLIFFLYSGDKHKAIFVLFSKIKQKYQKVDYSLKAKSCIIHYFALPIGTVNVIRIHLCVQLCVYTHAAVVVRNFESGKQEPNEIIPVLNLARIPRF